MPNWFEIGGVQPPVGARPVGGGFLPTFPESTGLDGDGNPVGAIGKLRLLISFEIVTEAGWNWWVAQLGGALYTTFASVNWFNPYKSGGAGWETWTGGGILHRPTFEAIDAGNYHGVEIMLSDVMES